MPINPKLLRNRISSQEPVSTGPPSRLSFSRKPSSAESVRLSRISPQESGAAGPSSRLSFSRKPSFAEPVRSTRTSSQDSVAVGPPSRLSFSRKPSFAEPGPSKQWKVSIILDARARRDYPAAFTAGEVSSPSDRIVLRTVDWLLKEAQRELGKVPLTGLR